MWVVLLVGRIAGLGVGGRSGDLFQDICGEDDFAGVPRRCWVNPVKHGVFERPEAWPWSSVCRDERFGAGAALRL